MGEMLLEELKGIIKEEIFNKIDLSRSLEDKEILDIIDEVIIGRSYESYISIGDKGQIRKEIFNSIRRLDVLQELVEDSSITEIMVNGPNHIFIEKNGQITLWKKSFESGKKLQDVVQQIVSKCNRVVNEASPIVDARLEDGSRINVVLPPIAIDGPIITIRKFPDKPITIEDLIRLESLSQETSDFLEKLVVSGYNIFISGGTGSGKTTFLNVLSDFIPTHERIITIEDSAELKIRNIPNLVRLEVRNANIEGNHGISIRDLIKSSLRMRPDRIIVGEVRDEAAIDMLQALNTGHDGSLSTGHANSPYDMLNRLESLVLLGADIPLLAVRRQIASALDIIIHLGRLRDKTRRVLEIVEVLECVNGEIKINKLYEFRERAEDIEGRVIGKLEKTSNELVNTSKLGRAGIKL